jgi:hypothetical protein
MTRKDYELLTVAISQASKEAKSLAELKGIQKATEHIAHALKVDNSAFNETKFWAFIKKLVKQ